MNNVSRRAEQYWEAVTVLRHIMPVEMRRDYVDGLISALAETDPDLLIRQRYLRVVHEFGRAASATG